MPVYVNIVVKTDEEEENYLLASARIRRVSKCELLRRMVKAALKDKMLGAILDDIKWEDD